LVFPNEGAEPAFAQIYVVGAGDLNEANYRATAARSPLNVDLLYSLQDWMSEQNTYARWFRRLGERSDVGEEATYSLTNYARQGIDQRVYNAPSTLEVGMVIEANSPDCIGKRDILLRTRANSLIHMTDNYSGYLPIQYPLFFPNGEQGWIHGLPSGSDRS
jgi:hypothetical protein